VSALEQLRAAGSAEDQHLYALVDAGRSEDVLTLLYRYNLQMRSLYQGESEARLGASGPHLVALDGNDEPLRALLRAGWGKAWGVFLTSAADFDEVRKHCRSLLMVKREKDGSELYFRFYDPRVLGAFLPTCSPQQVRLMFGPLSAYLIEAEGGTVTLRFESRDDQVACDRLELAAAGGSGAHA
jgi:hypothetical protein